MTGAFQRSKMLRAYWNGVNISFRTYAADKVIAEAYSDVFNFRQSSAMIKKTYYRML